MPEGAPHGFKAAPVLRGLTFPGVNPLEGSVSAKQPFALRESEDVLPRPGALGEQELVPKPTMSMTDAVVGQAPVRAAVLSTRATFPPSQTC